MKISTCVTDEDYEAWRRVRLDVVPGERCDSVAALRKQDSPDRLMLIATVDGQVVASGLADRSDSAGGGFVAPRVTVAHRRQGLGSAILDRLADHVAGLGVPEARATVDDPGSLAFAERLGFAEVDRQIEQVRAVADEPPPAPLPGDVRVITLDQEPELWAASYDSFGSQVLADFALFEPLEISAERWASWWAGEPMFIAVSEGDVVGCAGLHLDDDRPDRAENALTAVRRDWRGRGVAAHLKRRTLRWAFEHGVAELYTWTQAGNTAMLRLNEHLGYVTGRTSITVTRAIDRTSTGFVPAEFEPPTTLVTDQFRLEPLGPQHNESDHAAWTSSIEHIRATPGFTKSTWPPVTGMSLDANLSDLTRHAADFEARTGFTFTVLDPDDDDVIGCVYVYPGSDQAYDAGVRSWVRADRARLDVPLADAVAAWLASEWPWQRLNRYGR